MCQALASALWHAGFRGPTKAALKEKEREREREKEPAKSDSSHEPASLPRSSERNKWYAHPCLALCCNVQYSQNDTALRHSTQA